MSANQTGPRNKNARGRVSRWVIRAAALLVAVIGLGYAAFAGALWEVQDSIIFPRAAGYSSGRGLPSTGERIWYTAPDGRKIEAWYFKGAGRSAQSPGPLLVCFHGNADFIENWSWMAETCQREGFNVLLPEFRGYGRSEGEPSEKAIVEDSAAILRIVLQRPEIDGSKLVLLGRSLGGGVACAVALQVPPAALILECTFTSLASMADGYHVPRWLVRHPFRNDEALKTIKAPVMLVHGEHDRIIPHRHSEELKKLRPDAELVTLDCDHNDLPGNDEEKYKASFVEFLRSHGLWPSQPIAAAAERPASVNPRQTGQRARSAGD
ncbi:MAG: alpha/beta fold hydrolase [Phycisphaeraceae bacterium]|nr:alpha/beta fold hydrolase [Phycisphaeraceae bacterium]